ncbi:MAG: hypothetical protein AAGA05_05240 [Pseudomonadota bacterium]
MQVTLHIGAHRCATTTFQHYMRHNADRLTEAGIGFWGPRRTRSGLFAGIVSALPGRPRDAAFRRGAGRVQLNLAKAVGSGLNTLIVSDENMIGSTRSNLRAACLYPGIGERMARYHEAFGGLVTDVVLNIRSQETYWTSALGYALTRGRGVPGSEELDELTVAPRSWRDVITDLACAVPNTRIWVSPFETFAGRPEAQLELMTGTPAPQTHARDWLNATPPLPNLRDAVTDADRARLPEGDGRWRPFATEQAAVLRESYADDLMWLSAGADGLAWMAAETPITGAGQTAPGRDMTRGRTHDSQDGRMARAR